MKLKRLKIEIEEIWEIDKCNIEQEQYNIKTIQ